MTATKFVYFMLNYTQQSIFLKQLPNLATKGLFVLMIYSAAIIVYTIFGVYLYITLTHSRHIHKAGVLIGLTLAAILHAILLYPNIVTRYGFNFNIFNTISLTALFFLLFFMIFSLYRPILSLGLLAIPVAVIGLSLGHFGRSAYAPLSDISSLLEWHIVLSFAAYCVLLMGCVQAIILKLQIKELKHQTIHRFWVSKLPPLQSMQSLLFDMILVGFVLLSMALCLGFLATYDVLAQHIAHKLVFSVLSWLVFGWLIVGHYCYGWRSNKATNMVMGGFLLLAVGFVGTKAVLELIIHS